MKECEQCGAPVAGSRCGYCGQALTGSGGLPYVDAAAEKEALDSLHERIRQAKRLDAKAALLRNGFLPDSAPVLADAGRRCFGFLTYEPDEQEVAAAAFQRLQAVTNKLSGLPAEPATVQAVEHFAQQLQLYSQNSQRTLPVRRKRSSHLGWTVVAGLTVGFTIIGAWLMPPEGDAVMREIKTLACEKKVRELEAKLDIERISTHLAQEHLRKRPDPVVYRYANAAVLERLSKRFEAIAQKQGGDLCSATFETLRSNDAKLAHFHWTFEGQERLWSLQLFDDEWKVVAINETELQALFLASDFIKQQVPSPEKAKDPAKNPYY